MPLYQLSYKISKIIFTNTTTGQRGDFQEEIKAINFEANSDKEAIDFAESFHKNSQISIYQLLKYGPPIKLSWLILIATW